MYKDIVQVSYRNSYGKVLKNGWAQVAPRCALTGVKSSLGTLSVKNPKLFSFRIKMIISDYFSFFF